MLAAAGDEGAAGDAPGEAAPESAGTTEVSGTSLSDIAARTRLADIASITLAPSAAINTNCFAENLRVTIILIPLH